MNDLYSLLLVYSSTRRQKCTIRQLRSVSRFLSENKIANVRMAVLALMKYNVLYAFQHAQHAQQANSKRQHALLCRIECAPVTKLKMFYVTFLL